MWQQLRQDWLSYLERESPKGGAYKCRREGMNGPGEERELLLRFDDLLSFS